MNVSPWNTEPPLASYKVSYLRGLSYQPNPVNGVYLTLFQQGFMLVSKKLNNLFIPHNRIRSVVIVRGKGRYSFAFSDAIHDPRNIQMNFIDEYNRDQIIEMQMFETLDIQKNADACRRLITIMNNNRIFDRFIRPNQPAASPKEDVVAQIEKLGQLRQSGVITEEEFQMMKAKLINQFH